MKKPAPTLVKRQKAFLAMDDGYQPGAIISDSWGFQQTNVDFYQITERNGLRGEWLTLVPLQAITTETGFMCGTTFPSDRPKANGKQLRKKLSFQNGKPTGFSKWDATLWKGQPERCSWDA